MLKKIAPHFISLAIIFVLNLIYFLPQFEGKVIKAGDLVQVGAMGQEANEYKKKTGEQALWTNNMFSGMPTYQITGGYGGPIMLGFYKLTTFGLSQPAGSFIMGMILFYITLLIMGVGPWLSLIGAVLFGFSTNNLILFEAGHSAKINVLMTSAPIIGGIILAYRKKYLIGASLFSFALAMNIFYNHVQMSYYLALILVFLVIDYFVDSIVKKEFRSFMKASLFLLVGTVIAVACSASRLWVTYEYAQDTMRGKPILSAGTDNKAKKGNDGGLDYDYAMQWSNGTADLFASLIPRVVGGGSGEKVGKDTPFAKAIGSRKDVQAPLYFGDLPFTSGPAYFGAVALFLFVLGSFVVRGAMKWWLLGAFIFTMLLSLGKNFILNEFIYNFVPLYSKFRTPNSILSITAILVPILGVLGLAEITKTEDKSKFIRPLYFTLGILGSVCLLTYLLGGSLMSFETKNDESYKQVIDVLIETRQSLMASSALTSLFYILITAGSIWAYLKGKVSITVMTLIVGLFGFIDLFSVGKRYVGHDDFVSKRNFTSDWQPRPVDQQILQDKDPNYRVYDATVNTFNSALPSYHHKTIGGYHAAKLQRYQDVIERHISKGHQNVMDMLNAKYYIIPGQGEQPMVQMNPNAAGNAWFVQKLKMVDNANAEIDSLTNLDVKREAVVHNEFKDYVKDVGAADSLTSIKLTSYSPMKLEYDASVAANSLAVFSEIWYGPNKGWTAYIDGKPVDHIRVNYLLRGLKIPSGQHKIAFEFQPSAFYTGERISLIASLFLLGLMCYTIYSSFKRKELFA